MSDTKLVTLRKTTKRDPAIFFEQQRDPEARHMAAFVPPDPNDRTGFMQHWAKLLADPSITIRTILSGKEVAGHVVCFPMEGHPTIGYWLGREFWGRGIATAALRAFLEVIAVRPVYARVAKDNAASLRVLAKCGFTITGESRGFAEARGDVIEEYILVREAPGSQQEANDAR